jgi:Disulphide bond corrector protein DsbC
MKLRTALLTAVAALLLGASAHAQRMPWQSGNQQNGQRPQSVAYLYPEQVTIAANKPTEIDLHFRVAQGLHINSHTPREKSFIRTELIVAEPQGIKVSAVDFPPGSDYALAAEPKDILSVYTGDFTLKAHLTAKRGDHLLQAGLRYQACDTNSCFPPRTAPIAVDIIAK